jgi:hypothetical protein
MRRCRCARGLGGGGVYWAQGADILKGSAFVFDDSRVRGWWEVAMAWCDADSGAAGGDAGRC